MNRFYWTVALATVALAWGVSAWLYPGLPAKIPTHWNFRGQIDGYGSKGTVFLMPATMIFLLIVLGTLPALSPKSFEIEPFRSTYLFIMMLVIALMGYIQAMILYATHVAVHGGRFDLGRALFGGLFLFFALLGNVMGRVRRNFYVGVRVPWTLASERVWNDTHRVAAWLCVACGLIGLFIIIAGLPIPAALAVLAVALVVPIVYSFVRYKQLERRGAL